MSAVRSAVGPAHLLVTEHPPLASVRLFWLKTLHILQAHSTWASALRVSPAWSPTPRPHTQAAYHINWRTHSEHEWHDDDDVDDGVDVYEAAQPSCCQAAECITCFFCVCADLTQNRLMFYGHLSNKGACARIRTANAKFHAHVRRSQHHARPFQWNFINLKALVRCVLRLANFCCGRPSSGT